MYFCLYIHDVTLAGRKTLEESFPHHNMVLILLHQLLATCGYSLAIPSLYKFVTTPTKLPDELVCSEVCFLLMTCFANTQTTSILPSINPLLLLYRLASSGLVWEGLTRSMPGCWCPTTFLRCSQRQWLGYSSTDSRSHSQ